MIQTWALERVDFVLSEAQVVQQPEDAKYTLSILIPKWENCIHASRAHSSQRRTRRAREKGS